jgi:GPH family glycoside/pentoside/hexuronide:cation symporter
MFYSLVVLIQKIAVAGALPLIPLFLGATNYVANAPQQPASAVLGIRILTGPIPAFFLCAGIVFAILYPLTRETHFEVRQEIQRRKASTSEQAL